VAKKYVRTAMFSNRIERFCSSELSRMGKKPWGYILETSKRHCYKYIKTSQNRYKRCYEELFFVWSLRFSVLDVDE